MIHAFLWLSLALPPASAQSDDPSPADCRADLTVGVIRKLTADLGAEDPVRVRGALAGLIYMPLDERAGLYQWWWKKALVLAVNSREHGPLAALAFLRFYDVKAWGDVRTLADFGLLSAERQAGFVAALKEALKDVPFRLEAEIERVAVTSPEEWTVTGRLTYTRELAAALFGAPLRLDVEALRKPEQLRVTFGGPNLIRSRTQVTLAEAESVDLAYVDFEVAYYAGPAARDPLVITTVIDHAFKGRRRLPVPTP